VNSLFCILPYRYGSTWVFDDPQRGLLREPFVGGIPEMIDHVLALRQISTNKLQLTFSSSPFPGYDEEISMHESQFGGTVYSSEKYSMKGWLCPALLKYFETPPEKLYVKIDALTES
jgi:hypothetical protein